MPKEKMAFLQLVNISLTAQISSLVAFFVGNYSASSKCQAAMAFLQAIFDGMGYYSETIGTDNGAKQLRHHLRVGAGRNVYFLVILSFPNPIR